jgi:hypothetical protein
MATTPRMVPTLQVMVGQDTEDADHDQVVIVTPLAQRMLASMTREQRRLLYIVLENAAGDKWGTAIDPRAAPATPLPATVNP